MYRSWLKLLYFSLFIISGLPAHLQNRPALTNAEISLRRNVEAIRLADSDSLRIDLNTRFREELKAALLLEGSFDYPFDSLTVLSIVMPPDKKFRLITWNLQVSGANRFSGFIQLNGSKGKPSRLIDLEDKSDSLVNPETLVLGNRDWFGAVYYQVIPEKEHDGGQIYTLLGWHGINPLITSRVIEVLYFTADGEPRFGKSIFCSDSSASKRLVFKYSAKASLLLRYDEQMIVTGKKWDPSKREFEFFTEKHPMITMNRLMPMNPEMEGQYEYYIPASDVVDGFIFKNGCWSLTKDVDARNPQKKGSEKPKNP
jgi:hypothetical protein